MHELEDSMPIVELGARARLLELCKPNTTIFCVLRGVSRGAKAARVDLFVLGEHRPQCISQDVATLLDLRVSRDGGIYTGEGVEDVAVKLTRQLSYALHGHSDSDIFTALQNAGYSEGMAQQHVRSGALAPGHTLRSEWI